MSEKMRIGQLANLAGVTPRTVRYYESLGLLGPSERQGTGFRYYTCAELVRLQKIHDLKALGFSLEEIAEFMPFYFEEVPHRYSLEKLAASLKQRLQETDEKLVTLSHLRTDLQMSLDRIQQVLAELPANSISESDEANMKEAPELIAD